MTEEIMPREDKMGKILSFISGCIAGVAGVFAVAVMTELATSAETGGDNTPAAIDDGKIENL